MEKVLQEQPNLTEKEKINIVKNYFHGIEDQMYLFFVEMADIKLKNGEAENFYQAVDQLITEGFGSNKNKSNSPYKVENQAKDLLSINNNPRQSIFEKAKNKVDDIFAEMDEDVKKHPQFSGKIGIKNIIIKNNGKE